MGLGGALYAGVTGIRSHQSWLDVIGNNLSNINTYGYKSSRLLFSDLISQDKGSGGVNPMQVGMGVKVGSISSLFTQGTLEATNNEFDFAIQGNGFFVLSGGDKNFFSRVGTFATDSSNILVDSTSGYKVLDSAGKTITIPYGSTVSGTETSSTTLTGTLNSASSSSSGEVLLSSSALTYSDEATTGNFNTDMDYADGEEITIEYTDTKGGGNSTFAEITFTYGAANDGTTIADLLAYIDNEAFGDGSAFASLSDGKIIITSNAIGTIGLNDLDTNTTDYSNGNKITIAYTDPDGTSGSIEFTYGTTNDGTTIADLLAYINENAFGDSTGTAEDGSAFASLSSNGKIIVQSNTPGEDDLTLTISDGGTDTGTWADYEFLASTYTTSTTIYDAQGTGHNVTLTFIKKDDGEWDMRASMPSDDGTITVDTISSIKFKDDGSLQSSGDTTLTFKFDGTTTSQSVKFKLGTFGKTDGIYQSGKGSSVTVSDQDGSESGSFSSFSVDTDGTLSALYSNGTSSEIAQLQIATFGNVQGLRRSGDNLYEQTDSSGEPLYTVGGTGSAGDIYNGYLEASNVDMTSELTSLIMAQRGFQLNSRVISTADEVLAEAVNLKR